LPLLALAVLLAPGVATSAWAQPKAKADVKRVSFNSYDGVELSGDYYPSAGGKRDAVVLLLHDFDHKRGGNQGKMGALAARLQKDGYAVLTFDFRGFGDSKTVTNDFWGFPHNNNPMNIRKRGGAGGPPTTIDQKDFKAAYYPYLVNDIAAARAYLDRRNDAGELNSSNIVVIGAGHGATLGALWLAHEAALRKDKNPPNPLGFPLKPVLGDPEVKDVACAVWLSISPTLPGTAGPGRPIGNFVTGWLREVNGRNRVPMAFIYGQKDLTSRNFANSLLKSIKMGKPTVAGTGEKALRTKAYGSALLDRDATDTPNEALNWIVSTYLDRGVMSGRRAREAIKRQVEKYAYYYVLPNKAVVQAKRPGQEPRVAVNVFLGGR
jgi:dienelactone hydrolase